MEASIFFAPAYRSLSSFPSRLLRYGFAVIILALAIFIKLRFSLYIGDNTPFLPLTLACILSALYGGLGPGLLSSVIGAEFITFYFISPGSYYPRGEDHLIQVVIFLIQGALVSILSEMGIRSQRAMRERAAVYGKVAQAQADLGEGVIFIENEKITYANTAITRISGYDPEELTTLDRLFSILVPEEQPVMMARLQQRMLGQEVDEFYETAIHDKYGNRIELEVAVKALRTTGATPVNHLILLLRDITDRKIREEMRRKSEEHYRLIVENVRDYAIFTLKKNGTIASWNEGAERIIGYEENEIIGHHFSCLFTPEDIQQGMPELEMKQAEDAIRNEQEGWRVRKDGTLFYGSGVLTPLRNEKGQLRGYIKVLQDITARKQTEEQMQHQALHDALTDLPNRSLFNDRLSQAVATAERNDEMLAVMFLDLDQFKRINDTLGHGVGDTILKEVARRLQTSVRKHDTVARLGGDEFTILAPRVKSEAEVIRIAKKISKGLYPIFKVGDRELHVGTSIGIALYPKDGTDVQTLLKNADIALYQAKEQGRNTFQLFDATKDEGSDQRLTMESGLRQALNRGEFVLHYQPIMDAHTRQLTGMEALIRWNHPEFGLILPGKFIPLGEERDLLSAVNDWVLRCACRQNKLWTEKYGCKLQISVNLSTRQFTQEHFATRIASTLQETNLDPHQLELEITESFAMQNIEGAIFKLAQLKELGVHVAIDDFGTGHSSLNYLKRLPVDTLKIDKSFVEDCMHSREDAAIIEAIVLMAHNLKLRVIAEGVEEEGQLTYLQQRHCDAVQGHLFSAAMPANEAEAFLKNAVSQPMMTVTHQ